MIDAKKKIKNIILNNLPSGEFKVFLFGSRAIGNNSKWSDYDIGISGKRKLPISILAKIYNELEESDIPYKVDLVDFSNVSDKFKKSAMSKINPWN